MEEKAANSGIAASLGLLSREIITVSANRHLLYCGTVSFNPEK
jgi:hypothetical protein